MLDLVVDFAFMLYLTRKRKHVNNLNIKKNEDSRSNRETFRKGCR